MPGTAQEILAILVKNKKLSEAQSNEVETLSLNADESIESILLKKHLITDVDFAKARAESLGITFVVLSDKAIATDVANYIPEPVARRYALVPYRYDNKTNELFVAMEDPLDFQVIEFLEKKSGKLVRPVMAMKEDIISAIESTYTQSLGADVTEALRETQDSDVKTYEAGKLGEIIREAPIAQIVSATLEQAIKLRASDVHIEPQIGDTRIRYRVDGILQERLTLPRRLHEAVISRIKILADMKIDEKRIPQDGRFNFKMGEKEVDLRVSTLPTVHGEKVVMRLLKKSGGIPTLPELGLRGLALKNLETAMLRPHGIILVTGPTGSGKTTTLYAVLSRLNNSRVNILTLEDPVEYQIAGVNQVQINPQAGLSFAAGLRSFLRQDPNIILVGEIRDSETTDLAIQAALTGHLVFSTLHTNNAAGAVPRMIDLGAEPFLIASALNAVVGQRITRKICAQCREEYTPEKPIIDDIKTVLGPLLSPDTPMKLYHGSGKVGDQSCPSCGGSGYVGRIGVFEVFSITNEMSKLVLSRAPMRDIEALAVSQGMISMKQDGYQKALEGITSLEEVLRVAQD
jgi:type IV pilus assembly protein PilB